MAYRIVALILVFCWVLQSGCSAPAVQLLPPFSARLEEGDTIKIATKNDVVIRGRILYLDGEGVTLRVNRRATKVYPYMTELLSEKVAWEDIQRLETRAILDSRGKLITEEEIQENMLWRDRAKWMLSMALFGVGVGVYGIADEETDVGSRTFWLGSAVGATTGSFLGYVIGRKLDRDRAIRRIKHTQEIEAQKQE